MKGQFTVHECDHGRAKYIVNGQINQKRKRAFFRTREEADLYAKTKNTELQNGFRQKQVDRSDVTALKTQMENMQRQYEQRISAMESQMKALESKAHSGTILNTRILTDSSGEEKGVPAPVLEASLTKHLEYSIKFLNALELGSISDQAATMLLKIFSIRIENESVTPSAATENTVPNQLLKRITD